MFNRFISTSEDEPFEVNVFGFFGRDKLEVLYTERGQWSVNELVSAVVFVR